MFSLTVYWYTFYYPIILYSKIIDCYFNLKGDVSTSVLPFILLLHYVTMEDRAVGWGAELQDGSSRVQFPMVSLEFFISIILPFAQWPWGWLSLWQKWVPGIFPGDKGGRCVWLTFSWNPQGLSRLYLLPDDGRNYQPKHIINVDKLIYNHL
jgi:hypothetical protein